MSESALGNNAPLLPLIVIQRVEQVPSLWVRGEDIELADGQDAQWLYICHVDSSIGRRRAVVTANAVSL